MIVGRHEAFDLIDCAHMPKPDEWQALLEATARASGATPLDFVQHAFQNGGVTAVLLLAESHLAVHTWPEHHFVAVDLFTCGTAQANIERLTTALRPRAVYTPGPLFRGGSRQLSIAAYRPLEEA